MGKAAVNRQSVNISESGRAIEKTFTQQVPSRAIGPEIVNVAAGDNITVNVNDSVTVNKWKVMTTGDAGLKSAIYEFINTTKDGIKVTPDVLRGREKKMVFNFYGTMGKSIKPGEIGEFEVVFSYPPTVGNQTNTETTNS